ncbi:MAG: DUF3488 and DUF4129 domain-containing transglutaminase family protein [Sandaracinaceae bacterium]
MSFSRLHKGVAYLVAGLGFFALSLGDELGPASEIPIFVGLVASWFVEGDRIRDPRWGRGITLALIGLLALQLGRGWLGGSPLTLGLEFTAMLQLSRMFNRRSAAEYQQIAGIALLHLVAATVLSSEIGYAVAFFGFVVVTPWAFALAHLRAEIEKPRGMDEAEAARTLPRRLGSRNLVGAGFLFSTAGLSIPLFIGTGLLFLLFPRVGVGYLSLGAGAGQRTTGFGANIELGDFGVIRSDPTVVLRVTPPNLPESPPPLRTLRMRGTSFDHYDGRRWTRSRELLSVAVPAFDGFYPVPVRQPRLGQDEAWEVVLDHLDEPVLFFPPDAVGLQVPARVESGIDVSRSLTRAPGMDIRYTDADGLGLRYTAYVSSRPRSLTPLRASLAERYLQVPDGHERVAGLAARWVDGLADPEARAERVVARLRDSGEFAYSLEMPELGGRLPLEVFLFEAKRGHCEYYATAAVIMLRTLGIPARNVAGYLGGRFNGFGRYYALAQGDAHSWVEVWIEGRGWVTFDPTPPARGEIQPERGWTSGLRDALDAIQTRWANDIVAFDLRDQVNGLREMHALYRRWRGAFQEDPPSSADAETELTSADDSAPDRTPILLLAALAVMLLVLGWLWRRRRPTEDDGLTVEMREVVALYRAFERVMRAAGHPRSPHQTPLAHLEALERAGVATETARAVTDCYLKARFGGRMPPEGELARLHEAVAVLRK